jgi:hypothetical protein
MLAIRRTTVTLVAGNLEKEGVIICGRGYMQIVNRDALQRRSFGFGRDCPIKTIPRRYRRSCQNCCCCW